MKKVLLICVLVSCKLYGQKFDTIALTSPLGWNNWNTLNNKDSFITDNFSLAKSQLETMLKINGSSSTIPRSIGPNGDLHTVDIYDWCSGFFAGNLWYVYEFTKDSYLKKMAIHYTEILEPLKTRTSDHDLGFMMYCSYGNAYRLTGSKKYRDVLVESAMSLASRYNSKVGCIKSWDNASSWRDGRKLEFPVIIDNMMNLELLFFAYRATGNQRFRKIAISHAKYTMQNHLRADYSCYHVVNYDSIFGKVKSKETNQGFADNSAWSRGQAWGIYGFTMVYRETKEKQFLKTACKMADFFLNNEKLDTDKIPFWDFNINEIGFIPNWKYDANEFLIPPKDASSAAIVCSALFELCKYAGTKGIIYRKRAEQILHTLASDNYRARGGTNNGFILKHSVGNYPKHSEIDVPIVYADYYFLEALMRYNEIKNKNCN